MKIKYQLLAGFLLLVLVCAAGSGLSIANTRRVIEAGQDSASASAIYRAAVEYQHGASDLQTGVFVFAHGDRAIGGQLVRHGRAAMTHAAQSLASLALAEHVEALAELQHVEALANAAADQLLTNVGASNERSKLKIEQVLQFLQARVQALDLRLTVFTDEAKEDAVAALDHSQALGEYTRRATLVIVGVSLGLAVLLSLFLAQRISGPVKLLTEIADRVSRGEINQTVNITASGEIADLRNSFSRMVNAFKMMELMMKEDQATKEEAA
jgi:HAMP domain-containing protein